MAQSFHHEAVVHRVRYQYVRDEHGLPYCTIGSIEEGDVVYVAVSTWNGKQAFSKEIARNVVRGRVLKIYAVEHEASDGWIDTSDIHKTNVLSVEAYKRFVNLIEELTEEYGRIPVDIIASHLAAAGE